MKKITLILSSVFIISITCDGFKKAIFDFFENIKDFEAELQTLIFWNFHIPEIKPN
jgi:hypothetical protein